MRRIVVLAGMTGVRSMAGAATLAAARPGPATWVLLAAAIGEVIADKTPWVGNRTDALPLAGRAVIGGILGALVAADHDDDVVRGAALGAVTAVAAAQVAFYARTHLVPGAAGGLIEDALVLALASRVA